MNPASESNSLPPVDQNRLQFLLSCQFDGELTPEEAIELGTLAESASSLAFQASISEIQSRIRSVPVSPVGTEFAAAIHAAIEAELTRPSLSRAAVSPASSLPTERRGWIARSVVLVAIASCVLVLVVAVRPPSNAPSFATNDRHSGGAPLSLEMADSQALVMPENAPLADSALAMGFSADMSRGGAGMGGGRGLAVEYGAAEQQVALKPFLESDDWRIVVVRVNSNDRPTVMHEIETLVQDRRMDFRPVAGSDRDDSRFGVLLTSAGQDEKEFVKSVLAGQEAESADWDAKSVAESSSTSFIQRLQESMKTPTHSELHFGLVYLCLPKAAATDETPMLAATEVPAGEEEKSVAETSNARIAAPAIAKSGAMARSSGVPDDINRKMAVDEGVSAEGSIASPRKPVLVVFEFTEASTHGAFDGRI